MSELRRAGSSTDSALTLTLTKPGYTRMPELIGGFEYRAREGFAVHTARGRSRHRVDELTVVRPRKTPTTSNSQTRA